MMFASLVGRVRADFIEVPGLELTLPQAVRLWNMGADDCRYVIDALVDAGFLRWTTRRTIVRTGHDLRLRPERPELSHILVRHGEKRNKTVGNA